jgi:hypothetical protein
MRTTRLSQWQRRSIRLTAVACTAVFGFLLTPRPAHAQAAAAATSPAPVTVDDDADLDPDPAQPDFTLITLPTNLRLPKFKSAFRVTHRFTMPLGEGDGGDLASNFFTLDSSAFIGLEYRFGIARGLQGGVYRTSDRTIQFFGRYSVLTQRDGKPISLDASASIDGTNNFRDSYTPAIGAVISRELGSVAAVYVEPMWIGNSNPFPSELTEHDDTLMLGLGARVQLRPTLYVVAELAPRSGFEPGTNHASFGLEKRVGGHVFQINFSNGVGTMTSQLARGTSSYDDWHLGFNITRKFY